jgi:hypothetical protein
MGDFFVNFWIFIEKIKLNIYFNYLI